MNRRQYLASFSAFGASALAGCLDDVSGLRDSSSAGARRGPTVEMSPSYREADRDRRRAVGQLNRAAIALRPLTTELETDGGVSVEFDEPRRRIADARAFLESAAATDERTADDVAELRSLANVLSGVIDTTALVTDDDLSADVETLSEEINGRRLDAAEETTTDVRDRFSAARASLDPALETLEALDRDRLDGLAVVDLEPIAAGGALLDRLVDGLSALGAALESIVTGHRCLERGERRSENDRYADAVEAFEEAATRYERATARSEAAMSAPGDVRTRAETTRCQSVHLAAAAAAFADSARAADEPDPIAAARHEEAGQASLEAAEDCR